MNKGNKQKRFYVFVCKIKKNEDVEICVTPSVISDNKNCNTEIQLHIVIAKMNFVYWMTEK